MTTHPHPHCTRWPAQPGWWRKSHYAPSTSTGRRGSDTGDYKTDSPHKAMLAGSDLTCQDGKVFGSCTLTAAVKVPCRGGPKYPAYMMAVYETVTTVGGPNFCSERVQVPSNMCFEEWERIITSLADAHMEHCLKFSFLVEYDGPVPTPATSNHLLALRHMHDRICHHGGFRRSNTCTIGQAAFYAMVPCKYPTGMD